MSLFTLTAARSAGFCFSLGWLMPQRTDATTDTGPPATPPFSRARSSLDELSNAAGVSSTVGVARLESASVVMLGAFAQDDLPAMFGLSKRERYEHDVVVGLHAFFGDIDSTKRAEAIAPKLKEIFRDQWQVGLDQALAKGNSPRLAAFVLAVAYYQMTIKDLPNDERAAMQQCILENRGANDERPTMVFKIEFTTAYARGIATNELGAEMLLRGLIDIHRAIFGGDDNFEETVRYFFDGSDRIKAAAKDAYLRRRG